MAKGKAFDGGKVRLDEPAFLLMGFEFAQSRIKTATPDFDLAQPRIQFGPGVFVVSMHLLCRHKPLMMKSSQRSRKNPKNEPGFILFMTAL